MTQKKRRPAQPTPPSSATKTYPTQLATFDLATDGGLMPGGGVEISGYSGTGKSTFAGYLAGRVGKLIISIPTEDYAPEYIERCASWAGYKGKFHHVSPVDSKGLIQPHEKMMDEGLRAFTEAGPSALILDSIGAVTPVSELEGSVSDTVVGGAARIVARYMRKARLIAGTKQDSVFISTNHIHQVIGGQGSVTSGGMAVQYLHATRIRLDRAKEYDSGALEIRGRVSKLKFKNLADQPRQFHLIILPGVGVHPGLTAVIDCEKLGLAKIDRTVTLKGKSYGFFSRLVQNWNDPEQFQPFIKELR